MKKAITLMVASAALLTGISAEAKISKKERAALTKECKAENPGASKKEIKKCVVSKAKAH